MEFDLSGYINKKTVGGAVIIATMVFLVLFHLFAAFVLGYLLFQAGMCL